MESVTTRIDLQKLQLLNDRICQALDALHQVRCSVHATSFNHAGLPAPAFGFPQYGIPQYGAPQYGYSPYQTWGYPTAGYAPAGYPTAFAPNFGAFNGFNAFGGTNAFGGISPVVNPWQTAGINTGFAPAFTVPFNGQFGHPAANNAAF